MPDSGWFFDADYQWEHAVRRSSIAIWSLFRRTYKRIPSSRLQLENRQACLEDAA